MDLDSTRQSAINQQHLVLSMQMHCQWTSHKTQSTIMCRWMSTTIWHQLLPILCSSNYLDNCLTCSTFICVTQPALHQVNFMQAFPQADINVPVYLQILAGWQYKDEQGNTDYCLELTKNLYGTKQAMHRWFLHLHDGLLQQGFQQSTISPCLFFHKDCILVIYTDDCLIFVPSAPQVQAVICSLQANFLLKDKGKVKDFLGIHVHCDLTACTITLTQPGLINSVLTNLGLLFTDSHPVQHKFTPATSILHPDTEGAP